MTLINEETLYTLITRTLTENLTPDTDPWQTGWQNAQILAAATRIAADAADILSSSIAEIEKSGLSSPTYAILEKFYTKQKVNVPLLREQQPANYSRLVYIENNRAVRLIGRRSIYTQLLSLCDYNTQIKPYEQISVKELLTCLTESEAAPYLQEISYSQGKTIILKEETA
ncbi:MAG: hypothetical protein Q4Q04_04740 [Methanocorpusculum sp.]|nr:hypothetical protein [Methanocorpusculum sp.]